MKNALGSSASLPAAVGRQDIFFRSSVWAHSAPHVLGEDHLDGYPRGLHRRRLATGAHHRRRAATLRRRPAPHHGRSAPYGRRPSPRRRHPARPPLSHHFILPAHQCRRLSASREPPPSPPRPRSRPLPSWSPIIASDLLLRGRPCLQRHSDERFFAPARVAASFAHSCFPTRCRCAFVDLPILSVLLLINTSRMATDSSCASLCLYSRTICLLLFRVLHVVGTLVAHPSRQRSLDYVDAVVSAGDISRSDCSCIFVPVEFSS